MSRTVQIRDMKKQSYRSLFLASVVAAAVFTVPCGAPAQGIVGTDGGWKGKVPDEFRIKREQVFEFAEEPVVTRKGDNVAIRFATRGFCDVTVAIEDPGTSVAGAPKIVRHLASGVLGPNAPMPFQKNSKEQTLVWDGKNDQGVYIDDKDGLAVRVSLGLKPQFERTLLWSPHKQRGSMPMFAAAPEGVYVSDFLNNRVQVFSPEFKFESQGERCRKAANERGAALADAAWERNRNKHNEICMTVQNGGWGLVEGATHKSAEALWRCLAYARAHHCNLLANVGPLADGSIHPDDVATLKAIGQRIRDEGYPDPSLALEPSRTGHTDVG